MKEFVKIFRPFKVKRRTFIRGVASRGSCVQVYVLANDGMWYLQPPVYKLGRYWHVSIFLGTPVMPDHVDYTVVAVLTSERPETPLKELPDVVKSNEVILKVEQDA